MALFDLHKPVIAQVQGNCLAGGTDLALMCDMVVAADDARIGFPAARANGTPPQNMFVYHVRAAVGQAAADDGRLDLRRATRRASGW